MDKPDNAKRQPYKRNSGTASNNDKAAKHKISNNEIAAIEQYLSKEKGIDTVDKRIAYLKQLDLNNIDRELKKIGLKSAADRDQMLQAQEQAIESLRSFDKIVEDSPVFNPMRSDSALNILRHDPALKALGQTLTAMQSSLSGPEMAGLSQTLTAMQSSLSGPEMAGLSQTLTVIERSFGGFAQLNSKLQEVALVSGTAFEDALDAVRKAADQINYPVKETNSAIATEESHEFNRLAKEESPQVRSAEEEGWELRTEIPNLLKAVFALDFKEVLGLATLAVMTLDKLPQPNALSETSSVETVLAIIIIWVLVLAHLTEKSSPTRSADDSHNDSYERS